MQPVVTQQTQMVDRGCFAEQMIFKPALVQHPAHVAVRQHAPSIRPRGWSCTSGRASIGCRSTAGATRCRRVWQPNVVAEQIQRVGYVPQTVAEQVPVQVASYQTEEVCRKVPYQVCRIVAGAVRAEGALHGLPAGGRAGREEGAGPGLPDGRRGAGREDPGTDLPHGLRGARRAGAVPGVPDGGLPGDGPRAALRREADPGDVHLHRSAGGVLPRADRGVLRRGPGCMRVPAAVPAAPTPASTRPRRPDARARPTGRGGRRRGQPAAALLPAPRRRRPNRRAAEPTPAPPEAARRRAQLRPSRRGSAWCRSCLDHMAAPESGREPGAKDQVRISKAQTNARAESQARNGLHGSPRVCLLGFGN